MTIHVRAARSPAELEELRGPWQQLQGRHATTDPDVFPKMIEADARVIRPHALLLERDGAPRTLVLARVEELRLTTRIGYRTVYEPTVRALTVVYGGVLGHLDAHEAALTLEELRRELAAGEADVLRLRGLELGSPLHAAAASAGPRRLRERRPSVTPHWELDVPDSYDAFLQSLSRSTRESAKRYPKRLEKKFGDRVTLEVFHDVSDSERVFADVRRVAGKTYQQGLGVAFAQNDVQRRLTTELMERGWFRAYVLYLDAEPVAFWHGHAYRGVFSTGVPGFDPAHADLRVGNYVLLKLIADLCADPTMHTLDFGFGDAEYKRRFGTRSRQEQDVHLFAPSFKGLRTNAIRSGVLAAATGGRRLLERNKALDRVKRGWRDRLSRGASRR